MDMWLNFPPIHMVAALFRCYTNLYMVSMDVFHLQPIYVLATTRVLEHCDGESMQNAMMEEIMQSSVPLTQDQCGNYVIQAMNDERPVCKICGAKRKVLETCDGHNHELILSCIKVLLNATQ